MSLSVIVLNWNAADDTIACVRQLETWHHLNPSIWVVDNASTDGSAELVLRQCPQINLIRSPWNQGFAGGTNRGIEAALMSGDEPVLLLNNDAFLSERDAVQMLETLAGDHRTACVGSLLFDADDKSQLLSAGARDPSRRHLSHILHMPPADSIQAVECVPGTVILISASALRKIGLLDEDYFFSAEVADWCLRARSEAYLNVIDSRVRAYHRRSRSSQIRSQLHYYYIIRNRFLLIQKFHRRWSIPYRIFWSGYSLALWLKEMLAGHHGAARAIGLGLIDGVQGRFGNQNARVLGS